MPTRTTFLSRFFLFLEAFVCFSMLACSAAALPPGAGAGGFGGGHGLGGSGHFGGHSGRSVSNKPGGRFGWLHLGGRSKRSMGAGATFENSSSFWSSSLWNSVGFKNSFSAPPTMLLNRTVLRPESGVSHSFLEWRRGANRYHFRQYPFSRYGSSGCFFNGATQVCFFVPLLPFCGYGGAFYFDAGFDEDWIGSGDSSSQAGEAEMDTIAPVNALSDKGLTANSSKDEETLPGDPTVGKGQFTLVLKNGVQYAVSDYWVADGYLEYTIGDWTRSQVPLESLDLEATVAKNTPRGLPFVLRSRPGQEH